MLKEIKNNHEQDGPVFEKLKTFMKFNPDSPGSSAFLQAHQDRAYLLGLLDRQWISVKERLPEDNQETLIVFINKAGKHVGESLYKNGKFYYVAETDHGYYEEIFSCVTHWMPLPAPPESEAGE